MGIKELLLALLGIMIVSSVSFLFYFDYNIIKINGSLKTENYELRKQVKELRGYRYQASDWEEKDNKLEETCG